MEENKITMQEISPETPETPETPKAPETPETSAETE